MCICHRGIRATATTDPMAIRPFAECTPFMFPPRSAQCPFRGPRFLRVTICFCVTAPSISAKPSSIPRRRPHRPSTTSPSCSLTLRMDGCSTATVPTPAQAPWIYLTMTLIPMGQSACGPTIPSVETRELLLLVGQVVRQADTTTSLTTSSHSERSIAS